jgi:hypothetical protein
MKSWFNKCGDREIFWVMLGFFGLLVFGLNA